MRTRSIIALKNIVKALDDPRIPQHIKEYVALEILDIIITEYDADVNETRKRPVPEGEEVRP